MDEKILEHWEVKVSRDDKQAHTHVQLTNDGKTVFAADAYGPDMLNTTLRMLCDWVSDATAE